MIDTIVLCGNTEDIQGKSLFSWMFSKKREPNGPEPKFEKLAKKQWKWIEKQLENSKFVFIFVRNKIKNLNNFGQYLGRILFYV